MKRPIVMIAVTLLVGLSGGFMIGSRLTADKFQYAGHGPVQPTGPRVGGGESSMPRRFERATKPRLDNFGQINAIVGYGNRVQAMIDYYKSLSSDQFADEIEKVMEMPWQEKQFTMKLLLSQWGEKDPYAAMDYVSRYFYQDEMARDSVLKGWMSVDPFAVAKYYDDHLVDAHVRPGIPLLSFRTVASLAACMAHEDPEAALKWASDHSSKGRNQTLCEVVRAIRYQDPEKAIEFVKGMEGEDAFVSSFEIADVYGARDFNAAMAWASGFPDDQRQGVEARVIRGLAQSDPQAAALKLSSIKNSEHRYDALQGVAKELAKRDPMTAARLVVDSALSANAERSAFIHGVMEPTFRDEESARNFVMTVDDPKLHDLALSSYLSSYLYHPAVNPGLVQSADGIADTGVRSEIINKLLSRWMREDETAAKSYIESSTSIPEDVKQGILESGRN